MLVWSFYAVENGINWCSCIFGIMKKENVIIKGRSYYQGLKSKYLNLAKEASASGDRILCEYNLQFAEHYGRVINEKFPQQFPQPQRQHQQKPADKQVINQAAQAKNSESEVQNIEPVKEVILENKTRCVRKKPIKKEQIQDKVETVS